LIALHFVSPAGTVSVVGDLNDLIQLLPEALEVARLGAPFLAVGVELILAGPPKVLQEVDVGRKGIVQGPLGARAFLSVLLVVGVQEGVPEIGKAELGLLKDFLKRRKSEMK
jgi:hypothetical protein